MSNVDWSKPVEMVVLDGGWPVVSSYSQKDGSRLVIVRDDEGRHMAFNSKDCCNRFRNVRRKVKHSAKYWTITDRHGELEVTAWDKSANEWRKNSHFVVTEHTHEWEADADE